MRFSAGIEYAMYDTRYMQDMINRALLLGLQYEYIDTDKFIYMYHDKPCFNLDNYIKKTQKTSVIIPEYFYGVFIDITSQVYSKDKSYTFIFPKTVHFVGDINGINEDCIHFVTNFIKRNSYINTFKNSCFDFSRCECMHMIWAYNFANMEIGELKFGPGIRKVSEGAFRDAYIHNIKFDRLEYVENDAFRNASFDVADFGSSVCSVEQNGFKFRNIVQNIKLNYIEKLYTSAFRNIENVYIHFDIFDRNKVLASDLQKIVDQLNSEQIHVGKALADISIIDNKYMGRRSKNPILTGIEEALYGYYYKGDKAALSEIIRLIVSLIAKDNACNTNVYLYTNSSCNAKYDLLFETLSQGSKICCYIERMD